MNMLGKQIMEPFRGASVMENYFVYMGLIHYHEKGLYITDCVNLRKWNADEGLYHAMVNKSGIRDACGDIMTYHANVDTIIPLPGEKHRIEAISFGEQTSETSIPSIVVLRHRYVLAGMFMAYEHGYSVKNVHLIGQWNTTNGLGQLAINPGTAQPMLTPLPDVYGLNKSLLHVMTVNDPKSLKINVTV